MPRVVDWAVELPKAIAAFETVELERYVEAFEKWPRAIRRGCSQCAVGVMGGGLRSGKPEHGHYTCMLEKYQGHHSSPTVLRWDKPLLPTAVVEGCFEEYFLAGDLNAPSDPRLAIYQACVFELASRAVPECSEAALQGVAHAS